MGCQQELYPLSVRSIIEGLSWEGGFKQSFLGLLSLLLFFVSSRLYSHVFSPFSAISEDPYHSSPLASELSLACWNHSGLPHAPSEQNLELFECPESPLHLPLLQQNYPRSLGQQEISAAEKSSVLRVVLPLIVPLPSLSPPSLRALGRICRFQPNNHC